MTSNPSQSTTRVILLKTQSHPTDPYHTLLSQASNRRSYTPIFIPVLTHTFSASSLSHLRSLFRNPASFLSSFTAVVLTSQRAVEGLDHALSQEFSATANTEPSTQAVWNEYHKHQASRSTLGTKVLLQFYVVGPATHLSVCALADKYLPADLVTVSGQETGTGEALVDFILERHARGHAGQINPGSGPVPVNVLFPTGEKRRDTIPRILGEQPGWKVEEVPCYETVMREGFEGEFGTWMDNDPDELNGGGGEDDDDDEKEDVVWVVVFSPQGCEEMLRVCGWMESDRRIVRAEFGMPEGRVRARGQERGRRRRILVMSIGPTTQKYLLDEFGFVVDAVARKPSAEGVLEVLETFA